MAPRAKKARSTAEPASPAVPSDDLQKRLQMVKMIAMQKLAAVTPPAAVAASSSSTAAAPPTPAPAPAAESSTSISTPKPKPVASTKSTPADKKVTAAPSKPAATASSSIAVPIPVASKRGKGKAAAAPPTVASFAPTPSEDISTPARASPTSLKRPLPDAAEEEVDQLISSPPTAAEVPAPSPAVPKSVKNKLKKEKKQAKAAAKKEGDQGKEKEKETEQVEAPAPAEPSSAIKQASEKAVKLPKRKALKAAAAAAASSPAEATPTASTSTTTAEKAAVPPTPAQVKVKKALKRARSDSTSSSRPQSPARKPSTTIAPKSASKSNKRRKLSPAPAPPTSSQPIDTTAPPSLTSLYPTFLSSLQRAHPTAFAAPHTGPMFDTIRKFLLELRGSGAEGDAALFEFFKALVRSGASGGVESVWKRAKEVVGSEEVGEEEEKEERRKGKEERKRKRTEEKAARRAERKAAAKKEKLRKKEQKGEGEQEEVAPASPAPKVNGKGKEKEVPTPASAPVDAPASDAMEVDELASPSQETDEQRQAREEAELAERLAKRKAKKEKQEARKAAEKEQKRKEAEEKQKAAAVSAEEEPVIKISDSQLTAAAVPLPPSPVPASQPKPNGIVDPKSSPTKERRFRTNRLGKKEKEELRSSRQSSVANGNESDAGVAVAPAETQSEKPTMVADEVVEPAVDAPAPAPVVEEQSSQPDPATEEEEQVVAPVAAAEEPQVDAMEVDEPVAAPSPAQPEADKMDVDSAPTTDAQQLPNGDLSPEPEPEPEQPSSLAAAPTSVISKPAIFARSDSLKSRYSVASSEEDPEELELSLREHCSPARKSAPLPAESSSPSAPAPPSEDLYAPFSQRPESLKPKSPTKPEEVPLPPSRSASPEDDEEERVAPPPLRRQDTIGGDDSDDDSSSSDDDSSDESSDDEDFAPANARPRVKRTSLSAVAAAAFGKPGTPRAKSNLGKVSSPRRNQSQLSQSVRAADEEDEFDQLLSQSQPRKRLSIAHVLPQDDDEGKLVGGAGDDDDGASSNFSPVASSVEGTPRVAKKALNGKSRDSSEEPDTVDEDEEMAINVVANARVNGEDALGAATSSRLNGTTTNGTGDLPPSSAAMAPSFSSQSASQLPQPHYARLSTIGSVASSQAGDSSFELDEMTQSPNLAQGQPTSEESQWQGLPNKENPLFLEASQQEGESQVLGGAGESQLKEVENESMDPLDQTQVAFPVDGHGLPKGLSELMDQADTPQKIVVTAPTDDEAGLQTLHGASPSPAPSGRLTRSSAASRATTRSPSPGPTGPTKPRAAATAAAKRTTTRAASASAQSTPKANGVTPLSSSQPTPTARKTTPKVPSASQPLPSTSRLGARSASQMKSLSQLDAISSTPKSARTTRSRTAPLAAPATAPAKSGAAKWTRKAGESSDEESSSVDEEEGETKTTTTRSGRKSVGVVKGRKSLW